MDNTEAAMNASGERTLDKLPAVIRVQFTDLAQLPLEFALRRRGARSVVHRFFFARVRKSFRGGLGGRSCRSSESFCPDSLDHGPGMPLMRPR